MIDPIKNSTLILVLCSIVVAYVALQAIFFIRKAWRRGLELNMSTNVMKKVVLNSALVSIVPSLPIVISLFVLMQGLGRYFPWLRLSVVGSATYETMVASQTAQAYGLESISDPAFTGGIFISAMWAMTVGILGGLIADIFFLETFDKKLKAASKGKNAQFITIALGALFPALIAVFCVPNFMDFKNINSIIAMASSGIAVLLLGFIAKATKIKVIREFAMPIAMLFGMGVVILYSL